MSMTGNFTSTDERRDALIMAGTVLAVELGSRRIAEIIEIIERDASGSWGDKGPLVVKGLRYLSTGS